MLIDNVALIKSKLPQLWNALDNNKDKFVNSEITIELAKNGSPNVKVQKDNRAQYLHSKYDPENEAEQFVQQFDNIDEYEHVFFYGVGMGYHIEAFLKKFPKTYFTIYEPNPTLFYHYLDNKRMNDLPLKYLKHVYLEWTPEFILLAMSQFVENVNEKVLLVTLGSYERIYPEKAAKFSNDFKQALSNQRNSLGIGLRFERLWTYNSMVNFGEILQTEHVIREKRSFFANKPTILVAAGPSLEDEIERLRYIKEHGLAYIISVGSAIKSLMKNDIYPDAVCAYDPETGLEGLDVFQEVIEENITTIPLIFGSTLGFKTIKRYPGPLLHVFINQDTVSPFYLGAEQVGHAGGLISDAPSIAIVTLEILAKLGCNPIVLVGQNFAYRNNQYYASGIEYSTRPNELVGNEIDSLITTESVDGSEVSTSNAHLLSKTNMEVYISRMPNTEVINTTQGGAMIKGTQFTLLEELISDRLKERVVDPLWSDGNKTEYDKALIVKQARLMEREYKNSLKYIDGMLNVFRTMDKLVTSNDNKQLNKQFPIFDKHFKKLMSNQYFNVYMKPAIRVEMQMLQRATPDVRAEADPTEKASKILKSFGRFTYECQRINNFIVPEFMKLQQSLLEKPSVELHTD